MPESGSPERNKTTPGPTVFGFVGSKECTWNPRNPKRKRVPPLECAEAGTRSDDQPVPAGGDGVFGNWTGSPRPTVYGSTCVTTVHFGMLRPLARGTRLATDCAEATKRRAKAAACDANNFDFMTWASSTRGGIGREAAAWFTTNFAAKIA